MTASNLPDDLAASPHRRYNPLLDEWVLVSPGRAKRPWSGQEETTPPDDLPAYDPTCYLCPRNKRANGDTNPDYGGTFVFTNDFSALRPDTSTETFADGLLRAEGEQGTCRVVCFSPRHDLTIARMAPPEVRRIVDVWADQSTELGGRYRWVQVFENRGETMGASNPHPHGQIWAGTALPVIPAREDAAQRRHLEANGRSLLLDYVGQETGGPRVVVENDDWLVLTPFWGIWPFEAMLVARRPVQRVADLRDGERDTLATTLIELLVRCDNLFRHPFPYSMGWHQAPYDADSHDHWQLHAHLLPPLLRSATVRKFIAGYELLAETQRDITPEEAAERLRSLPSVHYRDARDEGT
ncbi:MAG TPA: UDP-glucose--hexose-1-phosphate uridylyltransferase [Candidatus Limnocylindrales bacterium]|nr:UDP-glucose--hexose-1-phosphate uridylyltransferase [Candidatus Limnocylindrales bacterium]